MRAIAHRGASGHAPENTLLAIETALDMGAAWIEIDVHRSADGHLVVIHDDTVDRTTDGAGAVAAMSLDALRALDAGRGERIPTLDEVFARAAGRAGIHVELKGDGTPVPVADFLARRFADGWKTHQVTVSSFDHEKLRQLRRRLPAARLGALCGAPLPPDAAFASLLAAASVHPPVAHLTPEFVDDAHARGLEVCVWTVNDPADVARMRAWGVDAVFTDYPERVLAPKP